MLVGMGLLSRWQEYAADQEAARFITPEDMIQCIERLAGKRHSEVDSFAHPSAARRIRRLVQLKGAGVVRS